MLLRQTKDLDHVGEIAGHGLVDEDGLAGGKDGLDLLQVRPAIDALQENTIDLSAEFLDTINDLQPILIPQLLGVCSHTIG